jgi:translocation and assembly module TamB
MRHSAGPRAGDEPRRAGGFRRWGPRVLGSAAGLLALMALSALVLLHSLERPWIKRRVQDRARASLGVDVDYRAVQVRLLSGVRIEGLVVRSPDEMRALAPDLARVDRVDARWRLATLLGRGPGLEELVLSGLTLTVVVDEHGRTSLDALSSTPGADVPLSRQASSLLGAPLPVGRLDADDVTLVVVRAAGGVASDRVELRGIAVTVNVTPDAKGSRVDAAFGAPAAPLDLRLSRAHGGAEAAARAKAWLAVGASASSLTAALDVRVAEQTFAPTVSADHGLHAEASLRFDAEAQRTFAELDHVEAGDGALRAEASIEIPDRGPPLVRHAQGEVDLGRLLGWLPPGLVPVTAVRAQVHYRIESLVAASVPDLSPGGSVGVEAELSNVAADLAGGSLAVASGKLTLHAEPREGGGIAGRGSFHLAGARLASGDTRLTAEDLDVDLEGQKGAGGAIEGRAAMRSGRIAAAAPMAVTARDGRAELHVHGLRPGADDPLATEGDLALSIAIDSLDARSASTHLIAEGLAVRAHARLEGHAQYAMELEAPVSRLRVLRGEGRALADGPARIGGELHDVVLDRARPAASRGVAHVTVDLGEASAALDATKGEDTLDFALHAAAPSLKRLRPVLAPALESAAPWDRIGVALRSSGHVAHVRGGAPSLQQTTELDVARPRFGDAAAESLSLVIRSTGTALQQEVSADLRARALTLDGEAASDEHVALRGTVDRERRALHLEIDGEGRATTRIVASLSFDPSRRAVPYDIEGNLAGLAPLAPFLAKVRGLEGFDLSELALGFSAKGALFGVVADVGRDGRVELEPQPSRTAGVEGAIDFRAARLRWTHGDTALSAPAAAWHGELRAAGARRTVKGHLEVDALHLDLGPRRMDFSGIRDDSSLVVTGDLADPDMALTQRTALRAVHQDVLPGYPIGDVTSALTAEREKDGVIHVSELKVANGAGGTTLAASGNAARGTGRRMLSMTAALDQDLARLEGASVPLPFSGHGALALEATVSSPNLSLFRVHAALKAHDVSFAMPRAGVDVEAFNGEIPVTVAVEVERGGAALRSGEKRSPYAMLRFTDQHPLLKRSGYVSIGRVRTRFVDIAPLAGNVEIEQNVLSLRQFEMGVRGGIVTGQCGLVWDGPRSTLELHVRASGVQSSHGEPFDGNVAVVIGAGDRTVEGRAEILRIGERHLRDLLDLEDPMRVDPAMNRVRSALTWGYPERLRLVFNHGFASAHLELGGLARLISIGEIRGIPRGPIVDKLVAPVVDPRMAR